MDWLQIAMALVTAIIGAAVPWWLQRITAKMDAREDERVKHEQDIVKRLDKLEVALTEMQAAEHERMSREQERLSQEQERMQEFCKFQDGIKAVLRDRILQSRRYFCNQGYIPAQEFENIEQMHNSYAAMGGNGLAHRAFLELSNLPFEPPVNDV